MRFNYFLKIALIVITVLLGLTLIGGVCLNWSFNQPCDPPVKPDKVPVSAVWKGGCDGGYWVEFVEIRGDTIRLRLYTDWSGELVVDADYVSGNSENIYLSNDNWSDIISFFDGSIIYSTVMKSNGHYCTFEPIYPVYYMKP
ncbi:MAG: hypothetical protein ACRC9Q_01545 [Bacteroidales bacterium]